MNSTNNNNKKTETKKGSNPRKTWRRSVNPFSMDIDDDFYDPFNRDIFGFDLLEKNMFRNFRNIFTDFGLPRCKNGRRKRRTKRRRN